MIAATCSWWSTNSTDWHPDSDARPMRPVPCGESGRSCWNSSGNSTWSGAGRFSRSHAIRRRGPPHQRRAGLRPQSPWWTRLFWPGSMGYWPPFPRPFWALRAWLRSPNHLRGRDRPSAWRRALRSSVALQCAGRLYPSWIVPLVWPPPPRTPRASEGDRPWPAVCWGRASTGQL